MKIKEKTKIIYRTGILMSRKELAPYDNDKTIELETQDFHEYNNIGVFCDRWNKTGIKDSRVI